LPSLTTPRTDPHVRFDERRTETGLLLKEPQPRPRPRAYFIMEYVEGRPIDVFCDEERLDINGRLDLF
jgi:hypothetical protein